MIAVVAAATLIAYVIYTASPETVAEVRHGPAGADAAVSGVRHFPVSVPGVPQGRGRQPLGSAADGLAAARLRGALGAVGDPDHLRRAAPAVLIGAEVRESHGSRDGRPAANAPRDGAARLPRPDEPGRLPGRGGARRRDRAQGQHLLALLLSGELDHAVAARRRDRGDAAGRLRPGAPPRLPQPDGRDRRPPRRAREQAGAGRGGPRPAQPPHLRAGRGVDRHP